MVFTKVGSHKSEYSNHEFQFEWLYNIFQLYFYIIIKDEKNIKDFVEIRDDSFMMDNKFALLVH